MRRKSNGVLLIYPTCASETYENQVVAEMGKLVIEVRIGDH